MANPAQLLLTYLTHLRENQSSAANLTHQRIAARHIDAIAELLDQMDAAQIKTILFRRYFDHWAQLVFTHPHGWQQGNARHRDDTALEHLEHLADRLDGLVPKLRDNGLDEIRAYTEELAAFVDEDDSIDPLLRLHVKQVIAHLDWCIENYDAVGDFDLQDAIERLIASMVRAAATSTHRERWKEWLDRIVWPFGVNVASALPAQALIQLALGA